MKNKLCSGNDHSRARSDSEASGVTIMEAEIGIEKFLDIYTGKKDDTVRVKVSTERFTTALGGAQGDHAIPWVFFLEFCSEIIHRQPLKELRARMYAALFPFELVIDEPNNAPEGYDCEKKENAEIAEQCTSTSKNKKYKKRIKSALDEQSRSQLAQESENYILKLVKRYARIERVTHKRTNNKKLSEGSNVCGIKSALRTMSDFLLMNATDQGRQQRTHFIRDSFGVKGKCVDGINKIFDGVSMGSIRKKYFLNHVMGVQDTEAEKFPIAPVVRAYIEDVFFTDLYEKITPELLGNYLFTCFDYPYMEVSEDESFGRTKVIGNINELRQLSIEYLYIIFGAFPGLLLVDADIKKAVLLIAEAFVRQLTNPERTLENWTKPIEQYDKDGNNFTKDLCKGFFETREKSEKSLSKASIVRETQRESTKKHGVKICNRDKSSDESCKLYIDCLGISFSHNKKIEAELKKINSEHPLFIKLADTIKTIKGSEDYKKLIRSKKGAYFIKCRTPIYKEMLQEILTFYEEKLIKTISKLAREEIALNIKNESEYGISSQKDTRAVRLAQNSIFPSNPKQKQVVKKDSETSEQDNALSTRKHVPNMKTKSKALGK